MDFLSGETPEGTLIDCLSATTQCHLSGGMDSLEDEGNFLTFFFFPQNNTLGRKF